MLVISVACCFRIFSLFLALLESSVPPPGPLPELVTMLDTPGPAAPVFILLELEATEVRVKPRPGPLAPRPLSD